MDIVLNYCPGRAIPHIRLQIKWGEDENISVKLTGVASPESFMLEYPQNTATTGWSFEIKWVYMCKNLWVK